MPSYHLAHCVPDPRMHGLYGYKEVIDSVSWGLEQLGHSVTYALNQFSTDATNIVFGAQVLPIDVLSRLPKGSIFYHFEQIRGLKGHEVREEVRYIANRFRIWDYSAANLESWRRLGRHDIEIVPVGYAPTLRRIPKPAEQDIDVLFYGLTGEARLRAFHALSHAGLSSVFVSGLYGPSRDGLIARAKLVLNVNLYEFAHILEVVRISYLLANEKAVVALVEPQTEIEDDIRPALRLTSAPMLAQDCVALVENDAARRELETAGFNAFSRRDIRSILRAVTAS